MKKIILSFLLSVATAAVSLAQKGSVRISVSPELALPEGDFGSIALLGHGGSVKCLIGIFPKGEITITPGIYSFKGKASVSVGIGDIKFTIIPVLMGYRYNLAGFYLEPQLGIGIYRAKNEFVHSSETAFTWAIGTGYRLKAFEAGVYFQSGVKEGDHNNFFGFRIGYDLTLKKNKQE